MNDSSNRDINYSSILKGIASIMQIARSKSKIILFLMLVGFISGFFYSYTRPVYYSSKITFVVEESKSSLGGLSSLAGQFGFDLGGKGGSFFSTDNMVFYLKSEILLKEVLLSKYSDSISLADKYIDVYGYDKKWKNKGLNQEINFSNITFQNSRLSDSLLQILLRKSILKNELVVFRPDRKASFIVISVNMRDEKLSQLFSERLLENAKKKYLNSILGTRIANVNNLQNRADSLERVIGIKTSSYADRTQSLVDLNPAMRSAGVDAEITNREKAVVSAIYTEVVKNLELAKSILNQETPAIEIIDQSFYPLEKVKTNYIKFSFIVGLFFAGLYFIVLVLMKWTKYQRA
jgi:uncharacterized protein involved in exopolysaccharide biosynthesis